MSIKTSLCYDALDRLVETTLLGEAPLRDFYSQDQLSTVVQGSLGFSIFRSANYLHAQMRLEASRRSTTLLVTDVNRSVLNEVHDAQHVPFGYMPYGYRHPVVGMNGLLAFNGERLNAMGHYLLGNGRRAFNPMLMCFNSPDQLSPFGRGGVNAFAYCKGDPINFNDPSGQFFQSILSALKIAQNVLRVGWKTYAVFVRPAQGGLYGVGVLASRAGYVTTAAGWGLQASGYSVGTTVSNVGAGLIGTGKSLKVAHKLITSVKGGKLSNSFKLRVRQLRGQAPSVDPEAGNIRSV
ncbi:RHS repeat-associated core domain-containing protein [Pseudomonas sp. SWRI74]|uniref:RHS repeat-associated core domain-containing protein n=1 Tax=Pseudomonas azerbaijanoccidentalis TaxID=2842347 RepID=A0ABS6QMH9_9PSED|nr:RHS repeat-associated core domain-containing protein [Pseudomonas azerbaijanoccidentalis]MBV4520144.1 RHS repeat-associated core domain-containing protein [Pseudomonas azerbaijanoccidentalis]